MPRYERPDPDAVSHPEAGMSDAEFKRRNRRAAQERSAAKPKNQAVADVLERLKATGNPYPAEAVASVALRDLEIIDQPPMDSRDKANLKEALSRVNKAFEREQSVNRVEYLSVNMDAIVASVSEAFRLESENKTQQAMDVLASMNLFHTDKVIKRERPDDIDAEPAQDPANGA